MRLHCLVPALAAFFLALPMPAWCQPLFSDRVGSGFSSPIFATSAPNDPNRLYVVEQGGNIRILNPSTGVTEGTFLNVATTSGANMLIGGEQGLLGLAFHPDYGNNGRFYVYYTTNNGNAGDTNGFSRIVEFTRSAGNSQVADPTSGRRILQFQQPFSNHNGGWMGFGPDGYLYVASGDGGGGNDPQNNAQNRGNLLGKMLRIDVNGDSFADPDINYAIPATNPFVGNTDGHREEIWNWGLRNPWRNSFDRGTGDLWMGDVGQGAFEEINFQPANSPGGENYGWRPKEGSGDNTNVPDPHPPGAVDPIHEYGRSIGRSVTGGYVYRGPDLIDPLNGGRIGGQYFFGDFITQTIFTLRRLPSGGIDVDDRTGTLRTSIDGFTLNSPASFGEDGYGNLYVVDYGGEIFWIRGTPIPEPGTLLLGLLAAGGVGWWRWRQKERLPVPTE